MFLCLTWDLSVFKHTHSLLFMVEHITLYKNTRVCFIQTGYSHHIDTPLQLLQPASNTSHNSVSCFFSPLTPISSAHRCTGDWGVDNQVSPFPTNHQLPMAP